MRNEGRAGAAADGGGRDARVATSDSGRLAQPCDHPAEISTRLAWRLGGSITEGPRLGGSIGGIADE